MNLQMPMLAVLLLCIGCASVPTPATSGDTADLLDGSALFGEPVRASDARLDDMLRLSPEMRGFIARYVPNRGIDRLRLQNVLRGMREEGYFDVVYDSDLTLTAAETFERRTGNCLSYTNLFIALARAAGLDARYEAVEVPPMWDSADDWVILNNHINSLVVGVRDTTFFTRDYVVDFNADDYRSSFGRRLIRDETAAAYFHSNRGVESLRSGDYRTAFAEFKRALVFDPGAATVWINLGGLYSRHADFGRAVAAYGMAVAAEPSSKSALTNLAQLYDRQGNHAMAEQYRQRIRRYEERNPYFHYRLALDAYAAENFPEALERVERAIALKRTDHQFYFLEGLIQYRTGDLDGARGSIAEARHYSDEVGLKERYSQKLDALRRRGRGSLDVD